MPTTVFTFDYATFIVSYPAFSNATAFPEATLQGYWDVAINYISDTNLGYLNGNARLLAINLFTAHLAALSVIIAGGMSPLLVQGAGVDKVNVSLTPPPLKNRFQWWLSTTPYGMQLLPLLSITSVGGFYVPAGFGPPPLLGFRNAGGGFG